MYNNTSYPFGSGSTTCIIICDNICYPGRSGGLTFITSEMQVLPCPVCLCACACTVHLERSKNVNDMLLTSGLCVVVNMQVNNNALKKHCIMSTSLTPLH